MPSFTRESGGTLHVAVMGVNRIGKDDPYEVSSTGNSVTLEEQAVKIADNSMQYQLASSLYGKSVAMLRMAISKR